MYLKLCKKNKFKSNKNNIELQYKNKKALKL